MEFRRLRCAERPLESLVYLTLCFLLALLVALVMLTVHAALVFCRRRRMRRCLREKRGSSPEVDPGVGAGASSAARAGDGASGAHSTHHHCTCHCAANSTCIGNTTPLRRRPPEPELPPLAAAAPMSHPRAGGANGVPPSASAPGLASAPGAGVGVDMGYGGGPLFECEERVWVSMEAAQLATPRRVSANVGPNYALAFQPQQSTSKQRVSLSRAPLAAAANNNNSLSALRESDGAAEGYSEDEPGYSTLRASGLLNDCQGPPSAGPGVTLALVGSEPVTLRSMSVGSSLAGTGQSPFGIGMPVGVDLIGSGPMRIPMPLPMHVILPPLSLAHPTSTAAAPMWVFAPPPGALGSAMGSAMVAPGAALWATRTTAEQMAAGAGGLISRAGAGMGSDSRLQTATAPNGDTGQLSSILRHSIGSRV